MPPPARGGARAPGALLAAGWCLLAVSAGTNDEGRKFLEENRDREGVVTLKSGQQYKVLRKGEGKYRPKKNSPCEVHYVGTTPGLTPDAVDKPDAEWVDFDSTYNKDKPIQLAPNQVIKGWVEILQMMVEGDKWEIYIPSELGYGDSGPPRQPPGKGRIKGGDVLIFRMEMVSIKGEKLRIAHCDVTTRENCEPEEIEILDEWGGKSAGEVGQELSRLHLKSREKLKTVEKEAVAARMKVIRALSKAKKRAEKEAGSSEL